MAYIATEDIVEFQDGRQNTWRTPPAAGPARARGSTPARPAPNGRVGDRVIDLAALERVAEQVGTSDDPAGGSRSPNLRPAAGTRRLRMITTLSVIAVVVLSVLTAISYRRGTTWRDLAIEQRARGEVLEQEVEAASKMVGEANAAVAQAEQARKAATAARDAASGQLDTSESDVAALEARIAALAGEKARLEDELAVAGQTVRADGQTDTALRQCVIAITAWLDGAPDDGEVTSWRLWAAEADQWEAGCDQAMTLSGS